LAARAGQDSTSPFELTGAPWIISDEFADALNKLNLPGVYFRPLFFKPYYLHYKGEICQGVQLHITEQKVYKPYFTGLKIMEICRLLYPEQDLFADASRVKMFDKVVGTDKIRLALINGMNIEQLQQNWETDLAEFQSIRKKYLLYQ
jgi:uncharacterized protein YbbC (DUF1343 family)